MWSFYGLINTRTKKVYTVVLSVFEFVLGHKATLNGKKILEIRVILEIRETKRDYNYG